MKDWRENYVICLHVAVDPNLGTRHRGFRVCCDECANLDDPENGFLLVEPLETETIGDLCIGHIARAEGAKP